MPRYSIVESFYASTPYKNFRNIIILQRGVRCEKCGVIPARSSLLHLHHVTELTPENIHDATITLNPERVLLLCHDCHDAEHKRFGQTPGKRVFIVYGPPCSGKTSYALDAMSKGDMLVDMDLLFYALSGMGLYDKPGNLIQNVYAIHNTLIDNIKVRYGKWYTAYVVGGYADKRKREKLADDLGAELVYCEATKEQCIERLMADGEKPHKEEWKLYIDRWFAEYQP